MQTLSRRSRTFFLVTSFLVLGALPAQAWTPLAFLTTSNGAEEVKYLYWQQVRDGRPIPFSISNEGAPSIDFSIDAFGALELAFRTWEHVPGVPISFSLQRTNTHQFGFDGENVIFFADLGDVGYGGVTIITYDNTTGQILDTDIHMNTHNISWLTSLNDENGEPLPCPCGGTIIPGNYYNDIQGMVTHEIGHALGLDHSAVGFRQSSSTPTMYALGIYYVPGEGSRPPDSYYRSLELDDRIGLQNLYPPANWQTQTAEINGVVHDRMDQKLFGANVVAKNLANGIEAGAMSGVVAGPYQEDVYQMRGLPPGQYEVRVEPINGSPPGYLSRSNFGGISQALIPAKFPATVDLPIMYYKFVYDPTLASPVTLSAGAAQTIPFRPVAMVKKLPSFIPKPAAFDIKGSLNPEVTGPLQKASLIYSIDGNAPIVSDLSLTAASFSVHIGIMPAASLMETWVEVLTAAGEKFQLPSTKLQIGLSDDPLVFVSKEGGWAISVVDTKTLFEIDEIGDSLCYPMGLLYHRGRGGIYVANYGHDIVSFIPLSDGRLPPTDPRPFDLDGDGLINELETIFGTDPNNPDTDGDLKLDGDEISQMENPGDFTGQPVFYVLGGTVANDGKTPLGAPLLNISAFNVSHGTWATGAMSMTPSGRFKLKLPSGDTYVITYYNATTGAWICDTGSFTGASGDLISIGVTEVNLPPPNPKIPDTGTDPLDPLYGALGVFSRPAVTIDVESGAKLYGIASSPDEQRYLYVTGNGSGKVYKVDTQTAQVVAQAAVGTYPKGVAVTPNGAKVYVANEGSSSVTVLNADTLDLIKTIPLAGQGEYIAFTADGATAVITVFGSNDVAFIDTANDTVRSTLSSGIGGLAFLGPHPAGADFSLAGNFVVANHQLALIDVSAKSARVIDLGSSINTTSGVAFHPDGKRGYVIHYMNPELIEFDVETGSILRRLAFNYVDIREILLVEQIKPDQPSLTVLKAGGGSGTITSSDGSISCSTACRKTYPINTAVNLTVVPASGSIFAGWSGCDSTSGNECTVAVNQPRNVTAAFGIAPPDLSITKSHIGNFTTGTNGTYSITVSNAATAGATTDTITVTDTLPVGLSFVSGTGTHWTCNASGQAVTCTNPGPIAAGAGGTIILTVAVAAAAVPSVTNTATVAVTGDSNLSNNTANDTTAVIGVPDLRISGQVTLSGRGLSPVTVYLTGTQTGSKRTDLSGNYTFNYLTAGGNYTVTPSQSGYSFSPPSSTFNNVTSSQTANFAAQQISLGVDKTSVSPGGVVNVTVTNGPGNPMDWVGLYAAGTAQSRYLDRQYLNGLKTATLNFTMPTTPGDYIFSFFASGSYNLLATSPKVTVASVTSALSITTASPLPNGKVGSPYATTIAATGGTPRYIWSCVSGSLPLGLGLNSNTGVISGVPTTAVTAATFTIQVTDGSTPALTARQEFKLTVEANANTQPTLGVDKTTVNPGDTVNVSVNNGPGNPKDWVGLYETTAAQSRYLDRQYLNGLKTAILNFTMPATPGTYNFRFFANDSYNLLATSPTVTVLTVTSPVTITTDSPLPNGKVGNAYAAAIVATGGTPRYSWSIVSGSLPQGLDLNLNTGAITGTPTTAVQATFTVQVSDSGSPAQTARGNFALQVDPTAAAAPTLGVDKTTVIPGDTVNVTVTNGPGNPTDWVGLYATTASNTRYVEKQYLGGVTSATLSFTMPSTPGTYNFRFFASDGYTLLATSPTVTVRAP